MTLTLCTLLVAAQLAAGGPVAVSSAPSPRPVEVVVFSDFQCPFCAMFSRPLRQVQTAGADGVAVDVTFKHFPLPMHTNARLAHQAAQAAAEQGKFWDMHDLLFANQRHVQRDDLIGYAKRIGLDLERFRRDLDSERIKQIVEADTLDGQQLHVNATPTFVVNGRQFSGHTPLDALQKIVLTEARARASTDVLDASLSLGPAGAPVTVQLFADLLSPISRDAVDVVRDVARRHPTAVRVQFRNFPLPFHPQAPLAHEAAVAAAGSGRFWEFTQRLLDRRSLATEQDLVAIAGALGLDQSSFAQALREHRYAARVDADVRSGRERGVRGSPTIVINGRRVDGVPTLEALTEQIEAALAARSTTDQARKQ